MGQLTGGHLKGLHSELKVTGHIGSSHVTCGTITAVTLITLVERLTADTLNVAKDCVCDLTCEQGQQRQRLQRLASFEGV